MLLLTIEAYIYWKILDSYCSKTQVGGSKCSTFKFFTLLLLNHPHLDSKILEVDI